VVVFCSEGDCVDLTVLQPMNSCALESNWDPLGLKVSEQMGFSGFVHVCILHVCKSVNVFVIFS